MARVRREDPRGRPGNWPFVYLRNFYLAHFRAGRAEDARKVRNYASRSRERAGANLVYSEKSHLDRQCGAGSPEGERPSALPAPAANQRERMAELAVADVLSLGNPSEIFGPRAGRALLRGKRSRRNGASLRELVEVDGVRWAMPTGRIRSEESSFQPAPLSSLRPCQFSSTDGPTTDSHPIRVSARSSPHHRPCAHARPPR